MLDGFELVEENEHVALALHFGRSVLLLTRKSSGRVTAAEIERMFWPVLAKIAEASTWGILFDTRQVVGRSDPEFERDATRLREFMLDRFARVAVLVRSMAGEMQVQRFSDTEDRMLVFRNLEHAMAFAAGEVGWS
jgi:predicted DNA-binding ribbon-helix-helix protein